MHPMSKAPFTLSAVVIAIVLSIVILTPATANADSFQKPSSDMRQMNHDSNNVCLLSIKNVPSL